MAFLSPIYECQAHQECRLLLFNSVNIAFFKNIDASVDTNYDDGVGSIEGIIQQQPVFLMLALVQYRLPTSLHLHASFR